MAHAASRGQVTGLRRPGRLPAEADSFVGRESELGAITALLQSARMVTVTGPAGAGKTRTALGAAGRAAAQYPDGTWLADLGAVDDPARVAPAVAEALGIADADEEPALAAVLAHLRGRELLLILDTCEHLVDAAAAFADTVLRAAPGVTLLATSRQPLDAQGEHAFPLLPLPAEGDDAVSLFAARAAAVVPGFTVTPQNRADVLRLCRQLDGIPLAIELAAVRLRALPLSELASQLESGLGTLLTFSRRGTSPRQQTLQAAVEWSYRLCSPAEQALWERLSVFAGSFDVRSAEQVCPDGVLPREQVLPALVGLVDKSVVLRDGAESARYRLPGALRRFGAGRLAESGGHEHFLDRLTAWSLTVARDFDERFRTGGRPYGRRARMTAPGSQAAALHQLDREYPSIRAALGWALGSGEPAGDPAEVTARWRRGTDLAVRLSGYWQLSGQLDEGGHWLGQIACLFPETARERLWALGARGHLAALQGDHDDALADITESIRLAAAAGRGAEPAEARGYLYLNLALTFAGRTAEALEAAETARQRLTACGHRSGLLSLEIQLALLHHLAGNTDEALACCERGQAILIDGGLAGTATGSGTPQGAGPGRVHCLSGYLQLVSGLALIARPETERAGADALRRGLAAKHELGDVLGTAYAVEALAWLAVRRGQYERSAWLLGAAEQLWAQTGQRLSGIAVMEDWRERADRVTRQALGPRRYATAYVHGAGLTLDALVRDAADESADPSPASGHPAVSAADRTPAASGTVTDGLTRREQEIAELVASGLSNREIAARLFISKRTVDAHVDHIFSKLEISSRVQLTVLLREPARERASGD
jgi:non-specific serine/threonine protein kinase